MYINNIQHRIYINCHLALKTQGAPSCKYRGGKVKCMLSERDVERQNRAFDLCVCGTFDGDAVCLKLALARGVVMCLSGK